MTYGQALARLEAMTAAASAPVLSNDELALLLESNQVADAAGLAPTAAGYAPTWDLNRAAAEGWRWKAAKVAGSFDFNADGASYSRSQMLAQCEKMVAQYQRRLVGSATIPSSTVLAALGDADAQAIEEEDEQL